MSHYGNSYEGFNNVYRNVENNILWDSQLQEDYISPLNDNNQSSDFTIHRNDSMNQSSNDNNQSSDFTIHRNDSMNQSSNDNNGEVSSAVDINVNQLNVNDVLMSTPIGDTNINIYITPEETVTYPNVSSIYHQPNSKILQEAIEMVGEENINIVAKIMNHFKLPQGFNYVIPNSNLCYLYAFGVLMYNADKNIYRYRCCCSMNCLKGITQQLLCVSLNKNNSYVTSKVSTHLQQHGIKSENMKRREDNKKASSEEIERTKATVAKCINPIRAYWLRVGLFIACRAIALSVVESSQFNNLLCDHPGYEQLSRYKIKKIIVEIYKAFISHVTEEIKESYRHVGGVPFLHINLDLWTSHANGKKYISIRIFFVNKYMQRRSYNIGVKLYNPGQELFEETASKLLLIWLNHCLNNVGATLQMILSSTTDSGPDVKRALSTVIQKYNINVYWDWCIPHLLSVALIHAMGTCLDKNKCTNKPMRSLILKIRKETATIKNSPNRYHQFQDLILDDENSNNTTIQNDVDHRWGSTINMLERALYRWEEMRKVREHESRFDYNKRELYLQIYSLVKPVHDIMKSCQGDKNSIPTADVVMRLSDLKNITLNNEVLLPKIDPKNYDKDAKVYPISRIVELTRGKLLYEIQKRFYHPFMKVNEKKSYMIELSLLMNPFTNDLSDIDELVKEPGSDNSAIANILKRRTKERAFQMALDIAKKKYNDQSNNPENHAADTIHTADTTQGDISNFVTKRRKKNGERHKEVADRLRGRKSSSSNENEDGCPYKQKVKAEFTKFFNLTEDDLVHLDHEKPMEFFFEHRKQFPILSLLACIIFAWTVSASSIEVDFGLMSLVQTPRRNRLHAALFDIMSMIYIHKDCSVFDDFNNIKELRPSECNEILKFIYLGVCDTFPLMQGEVTEPVITEEIIDEEENPDTIEFYDLGTEYVSDEEENNENEEDVRGNVDDLMNEPLFDDKKSNDDDNLSSNNK